MEAAVLFVFEVALIAGAFGAGARGYSDAQNECCEDGFESGFHGDVVWSWLMNDDCFFLKEEWD